MKADPLSDIHTFVVAAETGNFTRAARLLQLGPSAVSKSVARLEMELGVRLFHRSPREITLTGDGEAFFEACRQGMNVISDARSALAADSQPWRGKLRICVPVSFGQYVVAPALGAWLAERPGLDVELILADRHVDMTAERFDLAIKLGEVPDSRLVARSLPPHRFITVTSPGYLRQNGAPNVPAELADHVCLPYVMASTGQLRLWTYAKDGRQFQHRPLGPLATDHAAVLLKLAEDGHGIIQAPRYVVAASLQAGRLSQLLDGFESEGAPLAVVYDKSRHVSVRTRQAIDFLLDLGRHL